MAYIKELIQTVRKKYVLISKQELILMIAVSALGGFVLGALFSLGKSVTIGSYNRAGDGMKEDSCCKGESCGQICENE